MFFFCFLFYLLTYIQLRLSLRTHHGKEGKRWQTDGPKRRRLGLGMFYFILFYFVLLTNSLLNYRSIFVTYNATQQWSPTLLQKQAVGPFFYITTADPTSLQTQVMGPFSLPTQQRTPPRYKRQSWGRSLFFFMTVGMIMDPTLTTNMSQWGCFLFYM